MNAEHAKPIKHPPKIALFVVRSDFIGICTDSPSAYCAATLLGVFEYWTIHLQKQNSANKELPWIFKSQLSLKEDTLGAFGLNTIHKNLQWLVDGGYLNRRRNPKNRWDKTWQYQLAVDVIQPAIDEWWVTKSPENADSLDVNNRDTQFEVSTPEKESIETSDSKDAIQESTPEITKRVQHPTLAKTTTESARPKQLKRTKTSKAKRKRTSASQPASSEDKLKSTLASLCYPNLPSEDVLADGDEVRAIHHALKQLHRKTPTTLTPEILTQWGNWWRQHDFRGQRHQTPTPRQIVDTWMTFRNWRRGKAIQQQPLPNAVDPSVKRFDPITGTYIDMRRKPDGAVARIS